MKINIFNFFVYFVFFIVFLFPIDIMNNLLPIDLSKYIFFIISFVLFIHLTLKKRKIKKYTFVFILAILIVCFLKRSIEPLFLIEFLLLYEMLDYLDFEKINIRKIVVFSFLGIIIYSILYLSISDLRFVHTSVKEINQSSLAIFLLGVITHKNNKKLGNFILLLGILSFSRNYLLCFIIYYVSSFIDNKKLYEKIIKIINFKVLSVIGVALLIILSSVFDMKYENGELTDYKLGIERYYNIFDYSNYFRFTTNTHLIKYYVENPAKLLTGVDEYDFYDYTEQLANKNNKRYKAIKPHNFFFSFLRIYGIFSLYVFYLLNKIFTKIINKNNYGTFIALFVFNMILGTGFSNYWLFLSVFALIILGKGEENERNINYN